MSALRSRIPRELFDSAPSKDSARYLEGLDRRVPARLDLAGGATLAQTITAINLLFADMRENGMMDP